MSERANHALDEIELWSEGTVQQLERVADAMRAGAFFSLGSDRFRFTVDTHLLVVSAEHLRKALEQAPKSLGFGVLPPEIAAGIEILRDVYEHRDVHLQDRRKGRPPRKAAGRLLGAGSDNAFETTWGPDEFVIGGVLPHNALATEVNRIRSRAAELRAKRQSGPEAANAE